MGKKKPNPTADTGGNKWRRRMEKVECPTCENGRRRRRESCGLCHGKGWIMALEE